MLQHFSRIRLAPTIPLDKEAMRDLLELKDIVTLYELWTFFRIVHELAVLEGPPVRSGRPTRDHFRTDFAAGGAFEWASGVRLVYNQHFSRSRPRRRHSYSVPLRPDIALSIPNGRKSHLHLFDAKFRVRGLSHVGFGGSGEGGEDEKAGERAGSFKRGDIYKMHAYRDAIPEARSVWILDPGGGFRFSGARGAGGSLGTRRFLRPRGCRQTCRVSGRFRLLRLLGTRPAVVGEGHPRALVCCERHCDGCSGPEAVCQLHHTFSNVDITSRPAYA